MQPKVLRANLTRQIREQGLFDQHDHVLVAVSGGQDSLHLLRWLTEGTLPADVQPTVSAGYVNHQLRMMPLQRKRWFAEHLRSHRI